MKPVFRNTSYKFTGKDFIDGLYGTKDLFMNEYGLSEEENDELDRTATVLADVESNFWQGQKLQRSNPLVGKGKWYAAKAL